MDPPFRGRDDFCPADQEQPHSFFHRGPPPPPGEQDFDRRPFDDHRFPPRPGRFEDDRPGRDEDDFHRRRDDPDCERFSGGGGGGGGGGYHESGFPPEGGRGGGSGHHESGYPPEGGRGGGSGYHESGYPPEGGHHFPDVGFHRHRREESPDSSGHGGYGAPPSGHEYDKHSSGDFAAADHTPAKADSADDAAVTGQMDSLSLGLPQGQVVKIYCKANSAFNLAVEHNSLGMHDANPDDEAQLWIKDASYGFRVKDSYGHAAFCLVNKKTKKVLKHSGQEGQQVLMTDYQADMKDDAILWTESQDFGDGFKTVRAASNTLLNLTIFEGQKKVRNGSALMLDTWHKGDHQVWKLFPV